MENAKIDTIVRGEGLAIKAVYTITSFDSGHWVIPSFSISNGVQTDTIPIDVVFSDFDTEQEYHDIKDVIEVKVPKKKIAWWIYAAGLLVLIFVIAFLSRRKKQMVVVATPKLAIRPYDQAMKELEQLKGDKLVGKEYYSRLVDIFRLYIFREKGILSLQKTTDDLGIQLKNLHLDKEQFNKLSQALRLSDFVKFAKYIPDENEERTSYFDISNTIKLIEKSGS